MVVLRGTENDNGGLATLCNHEMLELAEFYLQGRANRAYLPVYSDSLLLVRCTIFAILFSRAES